MRVRWQGGSTGIPDAVIFASQSSVMINCRAVHRRYLTEMIAHSEFWKEDLLRCARRIENRQDQKRWLLRTYAALEKDIMLGFYSFRKLAESRKISDELRDRNMDVRQYRCIAKRVTCFDWHKLNEKYDLATPVASKESVIRLANFIVHSFVFMPAFDDYGRLAAVLFNSDRTRGRTLYEIAIRDVVSFFRELGSNYPSTITARFDAERGDYEVSVGPSMTI